MSEIPFYNAAPSQPERDEKSRRRHRRAQYPMFNRDGYSDLFLKSYNIPR